MPALIAGLTSGINGEKNKYVAIFGFCDILTYPAYFKYVVQNVLTWSIRSLVSPRTPPRFTVPLFLPPLLFLYSRAVLGACGAIYPPDPELAGPAGPISILPDL